MGMKNKIEIETETEIALLPIGPRGVQVYPNMDVWLTYQNFGSAWLGILRGPTEQIEQVFNGLFNLRATNGEMNYFDHCKTVATFWTSKPALIRFFRNQYLLVREPDNYKDEISANLMNEARLYVLIQMSELADGGHEALMDFSDTFFETSEYSMGKVSAERPDCDMKDAIISYAYRDRTNEKNNQEIIDLAAS